MPRLTGKCRPEPERLAAAADRGFDAVELYLTREHLDEYAVTVEACRAAPVAVTSVHTPHVELSEPDYFRAADDLAVEFDAVLVVHSSHVRIDDHAALRERVAFTATHGFENSTVESLDDVRSGVLDAGQNLILDVAHLRQGVGDGSLDRIEELVVDHGDAIPLVHLCDGDDEVDGLPFGEGDMPVERLCRLLKEEFDGLVVVEVMPDHQAAARAIYEVA